MQNVYALDFTGLAQGPFMHAAAALDRLAAIAHDLWRDRMERAGWTTGRRFDPREKRHDALVPFDQLGPRDRERAVLGIRALDCLELLAGAVEYQRGPDREFTLGDMREGLAVVHNDPEGRAALAPGEPGHIVEWKSDAGSLRAICVRWADGSTSEHHPAAGELRRLEDE
ncbi:MAG: RyR domain-containing protein [Phycisphaerales bacterium JB041]